jgi:hypothetical protein
MTVGGFGATSRHAFFLLIKKVAPICPNGGKAETENSLLNIYPA